MDNFCAGGDIRAGADSRNEFAVKDDDTIFNNAKRAARKIVAPVIASMSASFHRMHG